MFPYFLEKRLAIPTSPLFIYYGLCVTSNNNNHFHLHHQLLQRVFSECTEAIATSLMLAPIADGAPFKFLLAHQNKEGKGSSKKYGK